MKSRKYPDSLANRRARRVLALAALPVLAAAGCGSGGAGPDPAQPRTLTVLAAASLTEPFGMLERQFEASHPGVDVKVDYQGSSTLAEQIRQGRPADVFASANEKNMDKVAGEQLVKPPEEFARNHLEIAVPPGNPKNIRSFADLARPRMSVVTCAPAVPCGSATERVERAARVALHPVSEEQDVKSVLRKVTAGEADAGLVYSSDVRSAGDQAQGVPFPESGREVNRYPIAVVGDAPNEGLAGEFVGLVRSEAGQRALHDAGFDTSGAGAP